VPPKRPPQTSLPQPADAPPRSDADEVLHPLHSSHQRLTSTHHHRSTPPCTPGQHRTLTEQETGEENNEFGLRYCISSRFSGYRALRVVSPNGRTPCRLAYDKGINSLPTHLWWEQRGLDGKGRSVAGCGWSLQAACVD